MKEYLKMSDYFSGPVSVKFSGITTSIEYNAVSGDILMRDVHSALSHAINSHDELVAEVERLRMQLQYAFMAGWEEGINGMECDEAEIASVEIANQFSTT